MNDAAPSAWRVHQVVSIAQATLESLCNDHGVILETETELRAALAQEGVSVDGLLAAICAAALDAKADVEAANSRIDALCARRDRAAKRGAKLRDTLLDAMRAIGLRSFSCAEASVTVRPGMPRVVVTDVTQLPPDCIKTTIDPVKSAIAARLQDGEVIPGATLSNAPPVLSIRAS